MTTVQEPHLPRIQVLLEKLRFKGMTQCVEDELARAEREGHAASEVIYRLLTEEWRTRQERSLSNRIRHAKIPFSWTLSSFPFEQQKGVIKSQILGLSGLSFIQRSENIVFIGPPGVGKTGLAIGLLREALLNGYRGRFYNAQDLVDELYASLADRSTARLIKKLSQYDVLLIDELGYLSLKPEQVNAFFKLMEARYGNKSTLITTNLAYTQWYELFQRKSLVDALLDRLKHRCTTIEIKGPSLRTPQVSATPVTPKS
jgi:DNA replication protein DnaC